MLNWTQNFKGCLNLFLQSNCPLCQRPTNQEVCIDCTRQLQRCQLSNKGDRSTPELAVFAWGMYGGALKRAIAALKYDKQPQLAQPLGHWLGEAWLSSAASTRLIVVPIPMHVDKQKQRGFNQAQLLAQSFCDLTRLPLQPQGLERVRNTAPLFNISATQRTQNLTDAFALGAGFRHHQPNQPVIILDDIYTTGATAYCAAQTLRNAGITVFGVVAIATVPNRSC